MPSRRPRRRHGPHRDLDVDRALGGRRSESGPDGSWTVQKVRGSDKEYRCPGCNQQIPVGVPHVVTWSSDALLGAQAALELRRHWHGACWTARGRRR